MTNTLKWRLGKLPTSEEVRALVIDKLITKDEAREILFNQDENNPKSDSLSIDSLKEEIKFLRSLVQSMSNRITTVEHIRYVQAPYYNQPWFTPYSAYCSATNGGGGGGSVTTTAGNSIGYFATSNALYYADGLTAPSTDGINFDEIKTF